MEIKQTYKVEISSYTGLVVWLWINIHDQRDVRFIICAFLAGKVSNLYICRSCFRFICVASEEWYVKLGVNKKHTQNLS